MPAVTHAQLRHGTRLAFEGGRLVRVTRRDGGELVALAWDGDTLVGLEVPAPPGGAPVLVRGERVAHALFGEAHPVVVGPTPVTWMGTVEWARPSTIPPIEHPARIPGGAGTIILNTLAMLAERAPVEHVRYAGPYPTLALWQSLVQSYRVAGAGNDETTFCAGALERAARADMTPVAVDFVPAPFERVRAADGVMVQLRDGVERVTVGGETYAGDRGVRRLVPVDGEGGDRGIAAEVWLGGEPWSRVALVTNDAALLGGPWPLPAPTGDVVGQELPRELKAALSELVGELMAPPLAAVAGGVLAEVPVVWGDAGAAAARDRGDHIVVHAALWQRLAPRGLAQVALALAEALAAPIAARAQALLASMVALALAVMIGGCGRPPAPVVDPPSQRVPVTTPAEPSVLPLLAHALPASIDGRARLARFDRVWLDDRAPIAKRPDSAGLDNDVYVVVDERDDRVRLRVDDPWVRVLVWVQRDQLRPALGRDVVAGGQTRAIAPGAAITVRVGAPLILERGGGDGARVTVEDRELTGFATIAGDAIADVWRTPSASGVPDDVTRPRSPGAVMKGTEVRDAPALAGQVLARAERRLSATLEHSGAPPGWHRVQLDTEFLSITGFVPTAGWLAGAGTIVSSSEIVPGDSDGVLLRAGVCLYARPDGPLVGVILVDQSDARRIRGRWARWEWGTWWGRVPLYARPAGDDFERCPGTLSASR